jgi:hypothetical protein
VIRNFWTKKADDSAAIRYRKSVQHPLDHSQPGRKKKADFVKTARLAQPASRFESCSNFQ